MKRVGGERDVQMIRVDGRFVAVESHKKGRVVRFLAHTIVKGFIMFAIIYGTLYFGGVI